MLVVDCALKTTPLIVVHAWCVGPLSSAEWSQAAITDHLQRRVVNMFERRPHNQRRVHDHGMDGRACSGATTKIMNGRQYFMRPLSKVLWSRKRDIDHYV